MNQQEITDLVLAYRSAMLDVSVIDKSNTYPVYPESISRFMRILQLEPWVASDYQPAKIQEIMTSIETASLDEVRWSLTAAARSERFGDGMWAKILEGGQLDPVIDRLQVLGSCRF